MDVVDANGIPFGSFVSKTEGGLLLVGEACSNNCSDARLSLTGTNPMPNNDDAASGRSSGHGLLFGLSGETTGRLALEADGSMKWGAGKGSDFDTTLRRTLTNSTVWDPPPLSAVSPRAKIRVSLADVVQGDIVSVSHTAIDGEQDVELSGVASDGYVVVALRLAGEPADVKPGILRVVAGQWEESSHKQPAPPPPTPTPSKKKLVFYPPVAVDSGAGWGDTLHTLYLADHWNESVVFSYGNHNVQSRAGFVSVSTSGGRSWDMGRSSSDGGNWSHDLCPCLCLQLRRWGWI